MESFPTQEGTYNVPPVINPPQQVFGDYGSDSPPHNYYSGTYSADNDMQNGVDENGDPKRRRIARACDMCRKKKIKCDGKMPACSHCENSKTECIFTQVEKKRNPPKGAKYIEGLENRLRRMESLLELSGLIGEEDEGTDLGTLERRLADKAMSIHNSSTSATPAKSPGMTEPSGNGETLEPHQDSHQRERRPSTKSSLASPKPRPRQAEKRDKEKEGEVEALSDMMCSLVTNNVGETRYIGSSSGFSIFSPKGIQWVNEKTGDNSFQHRMSEASQEDNGSKSSPWNPEIFGDIFSRREFRSLPPLNEALSLLKDFFENFNCMFPLFHEPTFMHLVHRQYSRDPYKGSGWWASLNCALAIAHRLRVMSNLVPQDEDQKAWGFLKNALGVLAELTMRNTDLLSVQALLGMALFLLGTQNPQPSFLLVAAATRLAHSIGLHKRGSTFNLNPVEVEQRKRVFWIAYLLDKDMCLRSGRPPAQDDDDMNVELPSEDPGDNIGNIPLADGKGKTNLFRLMCTFAIIEGKVYKELYSTKASRFSDGELLNNIGELDRELEEWKDGIPADFRPENEIKASHTPLIIHIVMLHFAYYNCLQTIHRMSVHHGYWTSRLSNYAIQGLNARPLNPRVFSSATICVQAARSTIQLLKYIPQGDYACVWMIIYYPVSALMTLFTNVLQNPQDARARSDIRLMHQVVSFSSTLAGNATSDESGGVKRMLEVCVEFERIAKVVVEKSDKESHSRRKRKNVDANSDDGDHAAQTLAPEKRHQQQAGEGGPQHHTTPQAQHTPTPSTGLTPGYMGPGADLLAQPQSFSPAGAVNGGGHLSSSPAPPASGGSAADSAIGAVPTDPVGASSVLPNYVPQPGDFPNMFTEFADINTFGAPGLGSPSLGGAAGAAAGFNGHFGPQELWQMPMGLDWEEWPGMQADGGFTPAAADGGTQLQAP